MARMILNWVRYVIPAIALAVWLALLVPHLLHGDHDKAVATANLVWLVGGVANWFLPDNRRDFKAKATAFIAILILWGAVHVWADPHDWQWHRGINVCLLIFGGAVLIYYLIRAWETAVSPEAKKRWAAACLTAISIAVALAIGMGVIFLTLNWRAAMTNWDLLLVVFYLPVFGFAWFVREALIKRKRGK